MQKITFKDFNIWDKLYYLGFAPFLSVLNLFFAVVLLGSGRWLGLASLFAFLLIVGLGYFSFVLAVYNTYNRGIIARATAALNLAGSYGQEGRYGMMEAALHEYDRTMTRYAYRRDLKFPSQIFTWR